MPEWGRPFVVALARRAVLILSLLKERPYPDFLDWPLDGMHIVKYGALLSSRSRMRKKELEP